MSVWRCDPCQIEGEIPLWAQRRSDVGTFIACVKCSGRLRLVPLGAGDGEAQAWLEAHHVALALAAADNQQKMADAARAAADIRFAEALDYHVYGGSFTPKAQDVERRL